MSLSQPHLTFVTDGSWYSKLGEFRAEESTPISRRISWPQTSHRKTIMEGLKNEETSDSSSDLLKCEDGSEALWISYLLKGWHHLLFTDPEFWWWGSIGMARGGAEGVKSCLMSGPEGMSGVGMGRTNLQHNIFRWSACRWFSVAWGDGLL